MSIFAEDQEAGAILEWAAPPRVVAPDIITSAGIEFVAPSKRGRVWGHISDSGLRDLRALVSFEYKSPTGGMVWSESMEVIRGQPCAVVEQAENH